VHVAASREALSLRRRFVFLIDVRAIYKNTTFYVLPLNQHGIDRR